MSANPLVPPSLRAKKSSRSRKSRASMVKASAQISAVPPDSDDSCSTRTDPQTPAPSEHNDTVETDVVVVSAATWYDGGSAGFSAHDKSFITGLTKPRSYTPDILLESPAGPSVPHLPNSLLVESGGSKRDKRKRVVAKTGRNRPSSSVLFAEEDTDAAISVAVPGIPGASVKPSRPPTSSPVASGSPKAASESVVVRLPGSLESSQQLKYVAPCSTSAPAPASKDGIAPIRSSEPRKPLFRSQTSPSAISSPIARYSPAIPDHSTISTSKSFSSSPLMHAATASATDLSITEEDCYGMTYSQTFYDRHAVYASELEHPAMHDEQSVPVRSRILPSHAAGDGHPTCMAPLDMQFQQPHILLPPQHSPTYATPIYYYPVPHVIQQIPVPYAPSSPLLSSDHLHPEHQHQYQHQQHLYDSRPQHMQSYFTPPPRSAAVEIRDPSGALVSRHPTLSPAKDSFVQMISPSLDQYSQPPPYHGIAHQQQQPAFAYHTSMSYIQPPPSPPVGSYVELSDPAIVSQQRHQSEPMIVSRDASSPAAAGFFAFVQPGLQGHEMSAPYYG